jgi:hypothetical protein
LDDAPKFDYHYFHIFLGFFRAETREIDPRKLAAFKAVRLLSRFARPSKGAARSAECSTQVNPPPNLIYCTIKINSSVTRHGGA